MALSIDLPEQPLARLRAEATRRGVSVDDVVTDLAKTLPGDAAGSGAPRRRLSFAGSLDAEEDLAERSGQILLARWSVALPPGELLMLLADTGPLVAVANSRDQHHAVCQEFLETHPGPVAVPAPVIVEVCQLPASRRGTAAEAAFLTSLAAGEAAARGMLKPGECAVICSTVQQEAAEQGFSTAGLPVIEDGTSAVLRGQVARQLRAFGAAARGLENDATIGATALERNVPLITGDRALWQALLKLGGDARWFAPGD